MSVLSVLKIVFTRSGPRTGELGVGTQASVYAGSGVLGDFRTMPKGPGLVRKVDRKSVNQSHGWLLLGQCYLQCFTVRHSAVGISRIGVKIGP